MIALALAGTLAAMPGERAYRIAVHGPAGSAVTLAAAPPPGWTAALCTSRLCATGRVPLTIAATGTSYVALHFYPASGRAVRGVATVTAQNATLRLPI